jgi:hypothetical protein
MDIWDHDFSQVNIYSHIMHTCMHLGLSSSSKIHNDTNFEHRHCLLSICPTQLYTLYTLVHCATTNPEAIGENRGFFRIPLPHLILQVCVEQKRVWIIKNTRFLATASLVNHSSNFSSPFSLSHSTPRKNLWKLCTPHWPVIFDFASSITFNNSSLQGQTFLKVISWNWEPESNKTAPAVVQLLAHEETLITTYIPKYCDIHKKKLTTLKECKNSLTCQAWRASNDTQTTVTHMDLISKNPIIYENCPRAIENGVQ